MCWVCWSLQQWKVSSAQWPVWVNVKVYTQSPTFLHSLNSAKLSVSVTLMAQVSIDFRHVAYSRVSGYSPSRICHLKLLNVTSLHIIIIIVIICRKNTIHQLSYCQHIHACRDIDPSASSFEQIYGVSLLPQLSYIFKQEQSGSSNLKAAPCKENIVLTMAEATLSRYCNRASFKSSKPQSSHLSKSLQTLKNRIVSQQSSDVSTTSPLLDATYRSKYATTKVATKCVIIASSDDKTRFTPRSY